MKRPIQKIIFCDGTKKQFPVKWHTKLQSGIGGVSGEPLIAPDRMTIGTLAYDNAKKTVK